VVKISEPEVKDSVQVKMERVCGFLRKHLELLEQAVNSGDLNTADFLCGVILQSTTDLAQTIKARLSTR